MLHFILHLFGWYRGEIITKVDEDGNIWVAFKCFKCGEITGKCRTTLELKYGLRCSDG